MQPNTKLLEKINLFTLDTVQMRTFHLAWLMFFVCFFGWFGLAPLMPVIRADLGLTKTQVGNTVIASVSATIIARLLIGRLCDVLGPRKTAIRLLLIGSIPVALSGLAFNYTSFLLFRLTIGVIGASFVITQYHTSVLFAPRIKGTASAIAAGWGNLGGGVTNMVMPLIFAAILGFGCSPHYAMIVPAAGMWVVAWLYAKYTQDGPRTCTATRPKTPWSLLSRWPVAVLTLAYAMSFGMEITFDNIAALHFVDTYHLSASNAGLWAGLFGALNLFARALGGFTADKAGLRKGISGKATVLTITLCLEGIGLIAFAHAPTFPVAILCMLGFGLFLKMANGAVFSIVPFIDQQNVGLVSGVVGAGGILGGMLFALLFRSDSITYTQAFTYIGATVLITAVIIAFTQWQQADLSLPPSPSTAPAASPRYPSPRSG
jgi:NNP family nitrate/nitrite transporter-like MFS transporter